MNKRILIAALCAASLASTGCANMTPEEQNAAAAGAILGGLVVLGAALAARPTYRYTPPPRTTHCHSHYGRTTCTTY